MRSTTKNSWPFMMVLSTSANILWVLNTLLLSILTTSNLKYFTTTKKLNRHQGNWSIFFADYDFNIIFRPGRLNGKSDALSRRSDYRPSEEEEYGEPLLKKSQLMGFLSVVSSIEEAPIIAKIRQDLKSDPHAMRISADLVSHTDYTLKDDLLFYQGLLYVPESCRLQVLQDRHDALAAGHFGRAKTFELVSHDFWWPGLRRHIAKFISTCDLCSRAKGSRHRPYGLLQPLPIPTRNWQDISLDLIVELPPSSGHNAILVVVDRCTKAAHFIPCSFRHRWNHLC